MASLHDSALGTHGSWTSNIGVVASRRATEAVSVVIKDDLRFTINSSCKRGSGAPFLRFKSDDYKSYEQARDPRGTSSRVYYVVDRPS